jgi:hypothetical protein
VFHGLAANIGNVTLSSTTGGTITIAGNSFSGITKVGGGGQTPTILTNNGYYALNTNNANVFTQIDGVSPTFSSSYINIQVKTNGTQGSHQDAGSIITFYTTWQELISLGTTTTTTIGPTTTTTTAGPTYTQSGDTTSSLIYGAHTSSGGAAGYTMGYAMVSQTIDGGTWLSSGTFRSAQIQDNNIASDWFPLVPTMYGDVGGTLYQHQYCLGTSDIAPVVSPDFAFCWRSSQSNWSNSSIQTMLGFNSAQLGNVQTATQVWWNYFLASMNQSTSCGFAILNINDLTSGVQTCWDNRQQFYLADLEDNGEEWADQGFTFTPTVIGSTVTNVGPGSFTHIGNTGRGSMSVLGINGELNTNLRSDYTVTLGPNDLVIPIMKSNDGFSGGVSRGQAQARFGVMVPAAIPATTTTTSTTTILGTTVSAGTTTTLTAIYPSTGNIANTWGTVSFVPPGPTTTTTTSTSTTTTTTVAPVLNYEYTVPGTYTIPVSAVAGYPYLTLTMVGGGGGGGGNDGYGDTHAGGGGGSGGYSSLTLDTTGATVSFIVTVGAGGNPANVTFNGTPYPGIPPIPRTGTKSGASGGQTSLVYSLGNWGAGGGDGGIGNTGDNGDGVGGAGGTGITTPGNAGVTPIFPIPYDRNIYQAAPGGVSVYNGYGTGGASQNSNFGTNLDADLPQPGGNGYARLQFASTRPITTTTTTTTAAPVGTINTALFTYLTGRSFYTGATGPAVTPTVLIIFDGSGTFLLLNEAGTNLTDGAPNHQYWISGGGVNPGQYYWIRFTQTAVFGYFTTATTGWLQIGGLAGSQLAYVSNNYNGTTDSTYTIEIATDSAGTNIVATSTGVFISATQYPPPVS